MGGNGEKAGGFTEPKSAGEINIGTGKGKQYLGRHSCIKHPHQSSCKKSLIKF